MGAENVAELVELGGKIATICSELAEVRVKRDELNVHVSALEKELTPLLLRHSALISQLAGSALPVIQPPPSMAAPAGAVSTGMPGNEKTLLSNRVMRFLNDAEPGTGAMDIARALNVDAAKVREVLHDLASRSASTPMAVEQDLPKPG